MSLMIKPSSLMIKPFLLKGKVDVPASKSLSHRAIICASLCNNGESKINNIIFSDDINATIEGMKTLGAVITKTNDGILVKRNNIISNKIDCNESGSTLRFLIPLSMVLTNGCTFTAKGNLIKRPLDVYYNIFEKFNIEFTTNNGELPLKIRGKLPYDSYEVPGNISSQFITGLFFALPLLNGDSEIKITSQLESKNYIDLTIDILKKYNINIEKNKNFYYIKGKQEYKPFDYTVEGDFSQAAFFLVANQIGSNIECNGLNYNSLQGDKEILKIIKKFSLNPKEITVDASQIPDLVPAISVMAALSKDTKTIIVNAGRLRLKESDRLKAITVEMNKLGACIEETKNGLIIIGKERLKGNAETDSHNDHRIAMAIAIAATKCEKPIVLHGYKAVNKSYPMFWDDYESLGGTIVEFNNRQ